MMFVGVSSGNQSQQFYFIQWCQRLRAKNVLNFCSISDIVMVTWRWRHGVAGSRFIKNWLLLFLYGSYGTGWKTLAEKHWQTELIPFSSCTIFALSIFFHNNNIVALIAGRFHKRCQTESSPLQLTWLFHTRAHTRHTRHTLAKKKERISHRQKKSVTHLACATGYTLIVPPLIYNEMQKITLTGQYSRVTFILFLFLFLCLFRKCSSMHETFIICSSNRENENNEDI